MRSVLDYRTMTAMTLAALLALPVYGQDFSRLLDAVAKVETNLKALVEKESSERKAENARLQKQLATLQSAPATGSIVSTPDQQTAISSLQESVTQLKAQLKELASSQPTAGNSVAALSVPVHPNLANALADIEYLKGQVQALQAQNLSTQQQLASIDGDTYAPSAQNSLVEYASLTEKLSSLNIKLDEYVRANGTSQSTSHSLSGQSDIIGISGFVDASNYTEYNSSHSSFGLDQVEVDFVKGFSSKASVRADIDFSPADGFDNFDMTLEQGFLTYSFGNQSSWSFTFGKFNAPIGFELLDAPDMYQYSHALVFNLGLPTNLTGLKVNGKFSTVDWTAYVVNGWDVNSDNNQDKTFGTRIGFSPVAGFGVGLSAMNGPEQDDNNSSRRTVYDVDLSFSATSSWIFGGEYNYGTESKLLTDGTAAEWNGFLLMSRYDFTERFGITARYDRFNDMDGTRSGAPQTLNSFAFSPSVTLVDGFTGTFELRTDQSDQPIFVGAAGDLRKSSVSTGLEFTYKF